MNTQKGFTLIELMITIVIVAILAAIAIPNYQSYILNTRRAAAVTCLLELSQAIERFHTVNMTYAGFTLPSAQCSTDLNGHYSFSVADQAARTYTLSAIPQGTQASNDPASCGTLTMNQAGQKGALGGGNVGKCWR
ncbi:MAG: type IV pilin protein [Betaproteobacteria bacterium]|nr:type IV pilin protein [Betaproteobacteria bacterium]